MAASLLESMVKNHGFTDGNKPTAFVTAVMFLRLNGVMFRPEPVEGVRMMEDLARDAVGEAAFAEWFGWVRSGAATLDAEHRRQHEDQRAFKSVSVATNGW
ncbi:MAG: type II toxin-antitoxin system death-on-curing family toxin [Jannaschia sp.]